VPGLAGDLRGQQLRHLSVLRVQGSEHPGQDHEATVQRIPRHSSISVTTGTYVDVIEQVQHSAVAGMDSLLNPAQ
jgi:hypothetical protein